MLDIAAGTGLATEAAASVVGPSGHVVAADISPAMLEKARERLGMLPTVSFAVENGEFLTLPGESFDRVICNMGLMYFPDPARGLSEFRRVLRAGGRAAVSVYQSSAPSTSLTAAPWLAASSALSAGTCRQRRLKSNAFTPWGGNAISIRCSKPRICRGRIHLGSLSLHAPLVRRLRAKHRTWSGQ